MHLTAREPPQQETVDRPEGKLTVFGRRAGAFYMVEQPGDLAGGKIRIEQKSRLGGDFRFATGAPQGLAILGGAPVLPDDRIVDWLTALRGPR